MNHVLKILSITLCLILLHSCKKDPIPAPVLTTKDVTSINLTTAVCGGTIDAASLNITSKGICWSKNENPKTTDTKLTSSTSGTSFSVTMPGLATNTTYFVRAYATNSSGTGYGDVLSFTTLTDYSGQIANVEDVDGNIYPTIGIGTQIWMAANLATTKYNDGTPLEYITDNATWMKGRLSYSYYDNDPAHKTTYGALYNWYTIDPGSNGNKHVCPAGWHVPAEAEFQTLLDYLGPDASNKMRVTGGSIWFLDNTATNNSGFSAYPGGARNDTYGEFQFARDDGYFWASDHGIGGSYAYYMGLSTYGADAEYLWPVGMGLSIRCLKDN